MHDHLILTFILFLVTGFSKKEKNGNTVIFLRSGSYCPKLYSPIKNGHNLVSVEPRDLF